MEDKMKNVLFQVKEKIMKEPLLAILVLKQNLEEFLKEYTLHDSYLSLILADDDNTFTIGLKWDAFWNKNKLGLVKERDNLWPYLFISFPTVLKINWAMFEGNPSDTILETRSNKIDIKCIDDELQKSINRLSQKSDINIYKTHFQCLCSDIEIIHDEIVEIICVDVNGKVLNLSS